MSEPERVEEWMEFSVWLLNGIDRGWISPPDCVTHNSVPMTPEEDAEFEDGADPCIPASRIWFS